MTHRTELLIIDAQNDFCDLPDAWCAQDPVTGQPLRPALPVPGAHADLLRLAGFIAAAGPRIGGITVTLDSHHRYDIAHPPYWRRGDATPVAPFTSITAAQVRAGDFTPAVPAELQRTLAYLDALEATGRYTLMVWPVHCQLGSWGHSLHPAVLAACNAWEDAQHMPVRVVDKGSHPWSEHYSALQADALCLCDVMTRDIHVPPPLLQAVRAQLGDRRLVELVGTIASYNMVSRFLEALQIHSDDPR